MSTKDGRVTELVVDAYGCAADLHDRKKLTKAAEAAVKSVGAKIARSEAHAFVPHGLTLCLILEESHLVLSTWPEHQLVIANIFLCNSQMDPHRAWKALEKVLKPERVVFHEVPHVIRAMPPAKAA